MAFETKCYNGHHMVLDDELDGETVECPQCGEDFVASRNYEELGRVEEQNVPYNARGFIHMGLGLIIGVLFSYIIHNILISGYQSPFRYLVYMTMIIGGIYFVRGFIELFRGRDILLKPKQAFFAAYYIILKKIKFYRK